jgi:uncharacterized membrane protein YraQ (UPF0718 family)
MARKLKLQIGLIGLLFGIGLLLTPFLAYADNCPDGTNTDTGCSGTYTCSSDTASSASAAENCVAGDPITTYLQDTVDFLSALVGVVVVGTIIVGGIQYSLAGDNAQAVGAAKQRIVNGLIALVAFMLIAAFLQWIIPGGLLS